MPGGLGSTCTIAGRRELSTDAPGPGKPEALRCGLDGARLARTVTLGSSSMNFLPVLVNLICTGYCEYS